MDEENNIGDISPSEKCHNGINARFNFHKQDTDSPHLLSFINFHTQDAINDLGPTAPNWFEDVVVTPSQEKQDKGSVTPIQHSKGGNYPFSPCISPQLFSPCEDVKKLNSPWPPETPIFKALDQKTPGSISTPSQARNLLRSMKATSLCSDTPLGTESVFPASQLLMDNGNQEKHSTPRTFARSLGIDPNASQLSWTSSLATPPRATAELTSSEDEESADEKFKFGMGPARKLFSPQALNSDETDTDMEVLNYSMEPTGNESAVGLKTASDESQGTEPFSICCLEPTKFDEPLTSSGGMEFSCRRTDPNSNTSSDMSGKKTYESNSQNDMSSGEHELKVDGAVSKSTKCFTDYDNFDLEKGVASDKKGNSNQDVVVSDTSLKEESVVDCELSCNQHRSVSPTNSVSVTGVPGLVTPGRDDILSVLFKSPEKDTKRRLPPKKKRSLAVRVDTGMIPDNQTELVTSDEQYEVIPRSLSPNVSDEVPIDTRLDIFPFTEGYSCVKSASKLETLPFASAYSSAGGSVDSSESHENMEVVKEVLTPIQQKSNFLQKEVQSSVGVKIPSSNQTKGDTSNLKEDPNPKYRTPKSTTFPWQKHDSVIISPCDEFSQISPSTLQAVCELEQEYQTGSRPTETMTSESLDESRLSLVKECAKTPIIRSDLTIKVTGHSHEIYSPDGAVLFSQISPSTLEAIMNETDAVSEEHSKSRCNLKISTEQVSVNPLKESDQSAKLDCSTLSKEKSIVPCHDETGSVVKKEVRGLKATTSTSLCVTPVRWKNTNASARESHHKKENVERLNEFDIKGSSGLQTVLNQEKKAFNTSFLHHEPTATASLSEKPNARNLIGRKRKRFSYPTSSQITETCPSKRFCFGESDKPKAMNDLEKNHVKEETTERPIMKDTSAGSVGVNKVETSIDLNQSSAPDKLNRSVASPSSVRPKPQKRAGFTSFSTYQKSCGVNNDVPKTRDENHNVGYVSPSYYQAKAKIENDSTLSKCDMQKTLPSGRDLELESETENAKKISNSIIKLDSRDLPHSNRLESSEGFDSCVDAANLETMSTQMLALLEQKGMGQSGHSNSVLQQDLGGFSTAGGKEVQTSNKALKWAAKFVDEIDSQMPDKGCETSDRRTPIQREETSEKGPTHGDSTNSIVQQDFGGFSTAGGKEVKALDKALKWAAKLVDEVDCDVAAEETETNVKKTSVEKVESSGRSPYQGVSTNSVLQHDFDGFATAGGKEIMASDKALKWAAGLVNEIENKVLVKEKEKKSSIQRVESSGRSLDQGFPTNSVVQKGFDGFSTAGGKDVKASDKALKWAAGLVNEIENKVLVKDKGKKSSIQVVEASGRSLDQGVPTNSVVQKGFGGFSTAGGKEVKASDKALKWAGRLVDEIDGEVPVEEGKIKNEIESVGTESGESGVLEPQKGSCAGFSLASGKGVNICGKQMSRIKSPFEDLGDDLELGKPLDMKNEQLDEPLAVKIETQQAEVNLSGFSLASGKAIEICSEQLNKAKNLFEDCAVDDFELLQSEKENLQSTSLVCQNEQNDYGGQLNENRLVDNLKFENQNPTSNIHVKSERFQSNEMSACNSTTGDEDEISKKQLPRAESEIKVSEDAQQNLTSGYLSDEVNVADVVSSKVIPTDPDCEGPFVCDGDNLPDDGVELVAEEFEGNDCVDIAPDDITNTQFVRHVMDDFSDTQLCAMTENTGDFYDHDGMDLEILPEVDEGKEPEMRQDLATPGNDMPITNNLPAIIPSNKLSQKECPDCHAECHCDKNSNNRNLIATDDFQSDFQTASGYALSISKTAVQTFQNSFENDDSVHDSCQPMEEDGCSGGFYPVLEQVDGVKLNPECEEACDGTSTQSLLEKDTCEQDETQDGANFDVSSKDFVGFTTAGGSKVNVSEKALRSARVKLSECAESLLPEKPSNDFNVPGGYGVTTARGSKVEVWDESLQLARDKVADFVPEHLPVKKDTDTLKTLCGFRGISTASGSKVEVSEKALQSVRGKLEDLDAEHTPPEKSKDKFNAPEGFVGFTTARGSKVQVSDKALQSARDKLADFTTESLPLEKEDVNLTGADRGFGGFTTARGPEVQVSDKALQSCQLAREKLTDFATETLPLKKEEDGLTGAGRGFGGFTTARGSKVEVSKKALQSARDKLGELDAEPIPHEEGTHNLHVDALKEFGGFATAGGSKVKVSDKALQSAREKLPDFATETLPLEKEEDGLTGAGRGFGGFTTARGSKVEVSEKALQSARGKLADSSPLKKDIVDLDGKSRGFGGFTTARGSKVQVSNRAFQTAREKLADFTSESLPQEDDNLTLAGRGFGGFTTARGSKVNISEKALQSVRDKLEDGTTEYVPLRKDAGNFEDESKRFGGFTTAKGSKVNISEKALQCVRDKLEDRATDNVGTDNVDDAPKRFGGFTTARGSKVQVSDKALQLARGKLADCNTESVNLEKDGVENDNLESKLKQFGGFTTVSGSKVEVSGKALQSARGKLADCNTEIPEFESGASGGVPKIFAGESKRCYGFTTAKGSKVEVSEKALLSARGQLADCNSEIPQFEASDDAPKSLESGSNRCQGFMTAKGTEVKVSDKALKLARDKISDEIAPNKTVDDFCIIEGFKMTEDETKRRDTCIQKGTVEHSKSIFPGVKTSRKPMFVGVIQNEQRASNSSSSVNASSERKPSRFLMQVPKKSSERRVITEVDVSGLDVGASTGSREAVKSNPEGTLYDNLPRRRTGQARSSVRSTPHGDSTSSMLQFHTSFKQQNPQVPKRPSSFVTPTKNHASDQPHSSPTLGQPSSFNTPYKKPQEGNFSTPFKATPDKGFAAPFKATPQDKSTTEPNAKSSPGPESDICNVKAKSLDFSSTRIEATSIENINEISDTTLVQYSPPERSDEMKSSLSKEAMEIITCAWQEERMGQEFAIKKKKRAKITAMSGGLFEKRTSASVTRMKLRDAVQDGTPGSFSRQQLHQLGVCDNTLTVTAQTAANFSFLILELYSEAVLLQHPHLLLGDGAKLVPNDYGNAGKEEFANAFLGMPGVDPRLISDAWLHNQYRWIIWKLAAMEVAFPYHFGGRCLTPEQVMLRLKYRYDREVDHCQRSALKKIYERDDTPSKRMVLCVAGIVSIPENNPLAGQAVVELTDGWYGIKTSLDKPLTGLLRAGKIGIGQKLCICGAELTGSQDACSPLEAPADLMLKIFANSSRRARWDARLGFCDCPQPFAVPLNSLYPEGGLVGSVDVVVTRVYPTQYMEKLPDGNNVFRSARMEEKIAKQHEKRKEIALETLQAKLQKQFEDDERKEKKKTSSMRKWTRNQVEVLQTGCDIFEAMEQASDPCVIQDYLSDHQMALLADYRQEQINERQSRLRTELQKALEENQEKASLTRQVVPLYKVRVAGTSTSDMDRRISTFLTVWRPSEGTTQILSEGKRLKIFNLSASPGRGWQNKNTSLSATRTTQYQPMKADENFMDLVYEPREVSCVGTMQQPPLYGELDLAVMVVSVPPETQRVNGFESILTCDHLGNIAIIKFWDSLQNYGVGELLQPGVYVGVLNASWRRDSATGPIRCVYVSESTHFTTKPNEAHLRAALEKLQQEIKDPKAMIVDVKKKADYLVTLNREHLRANLQPNKTGSCTPQTVSKNIGGQSVESKYYSSPAVSSRSPDPLVGSVANKDQVSSTKSKQFQQGSVPHAALMDCLSPMDEEENVKLSQQRVLQRSKAKRLEFYEAVDGGPPLPQVISTPVSKKLRQDFKAPSSCKTVKESVSGTPLVKETLQTVSDLDDDECSSLKDSHANSEESVCVTKLSTPVLRTGLMARARRIGLVSHRRSSVLPSSELKVKQESPCGESNVSESSVLNVKNTFVDSVEESHGEMCAISDCKPRTEDSQLGDTMASRPFANSQSRTLLKEGSGDGCDIHVVLSEDCDAVSGTESSQSQLSDSNLAEGTAKNKRKHCAEFSPGGAKRRKSTRLCRRK